LVYAPSESDPCAEPHQPLAERAGHPPEGRAAEAAVRIAEVRSVGEVEEIGLSSPPIRSVKLNRLKIEASRLT